MFLPQFKKRKGKEEAPNIKTECTKAAPHSHPRPPPQAQLKPAVDPGRWVAVEAESQLRGGPRRRQCEKLILANGLVAPPLRCHQGPPAASADSPKIFTGWKR